MLDMIERCQDTQCITVCSHRPNRVPMRPLCTAKRGSVMLCWETLGSGIHVAFTLTRSTYLQLLQTTCSPFMAALFTDGSGLFQLDNAPCHTAETVKNGLRNMTKSSRCCLGLQFPQMSRLLSIYGMCWTYKCDSWRTYLTPFRT